MKILSDSYKNTIKKYGDYKDNLSKTSKEWDYFKVKLNRVNY